MADSFRVLGRRQGVEELEHLANGLRVVLVPDPIVPVAAVCVVYHVGSRNEGVGHTGATHLLEHLLFKGSEKFNAEVGRPVARVLERVGAAFNATTWLDRTNYYETLPAEHVELALELEADRMRRALLRGEDLASEMTVVRNEFERGENEPFEVLLKESFATAFREHPYHHPTIGWRSDIESVTIDRLRAFYDTFYYPNNASLIVVGAYERNALLGLIDRHFSPLPRAPRPLPPVMNAEPAQQGERRFVVRRAGEVGWLALSWRTPQAAHADTHALAVLADALGGGVTARLYQRLVESGRCLDIQVVAWQLKDPGLFQLFATLSPGTPHAEVEEAVREEVGRLVREGLAEDELQRAKAQVEAFTAYHRDAPGQVAAALTESISAVDWRFYLDYLGKVRATTVEDVRRVAASWLHDNALTVGAFVPTNGGGEGSSGGALPQRVRPRPCHLRPLVADQVVEAALPGGARALLLPRRHNPTVHLHASLLAGHGVEAPGAWTAASILPDMLERGTERYSRMALARAMEDRGIELGVSGESFNPLEVVAVGRCLSRHLELFLDLAFEMLRAPTFPPAELEKVRQLRLGELAQAREDTFQRAFEAFSRLVYPPGHPYYTRPVEERREGLEQLGVAALQELHARLYGPASLVLALVGDFEPDAVQRRLASLVAGWAGGLSAPPEVERREPADAMAGSVREPMADKPNVDVLLGHPGGLRRRDEDFVPAQLGNAVLGHSTLSSRLGRRLRDREGLTYGVISRFFGASLADGPWAVTFSISPASLERGLASAREEIERFWTEGPTEEELDDERQAYAGSYRVALSTPAGLAREISRLARHLLPVEELDSVPERVLGTRRSEVLAAVRRHLSPANLSAAAAGELVDQAPAGG